MKIFLVRISVFWLLFTVVLCLVFSLQRQKINQPEHLRLPQGVSKIIMGHSMPVNAYNDSLLPSFRNVAQLGEAYFYTFQKLRILLLNNPQLTHVFLEYNTNQITPNMEEWTYGDEMVNYHLAKYLQLMPLKDAIHLFQKNPKAVANVFPKMLKSNFLFLLNGQKDYIRSFDWGRYSYNAYDRYDSLMRVYEQSPKPPQTDTFVSRVNLYYLDQIVKLCKQNNVALYFISSPQPAPHNPPNEKVFLDVLKNKYPDIPHLDFRRFPMTKFEFSDLSHLNYRGAKKITLFLQELIKQGLLEKEDKSQIINTAIMQVSSKKNDNKL